MYLHLLIIVWLESCPSNIFTFLNPPPLRNTHKFLFTQYYTLTVLFLQQTSGRFCLKTQLDFGL